MSEDSTPFGGSSYLYCSNCGAPTPVDAQFCAKCGATQGGGGVAAPTGVPAPAGGVVPATVAPYAAPAGREMYAGFWLRVVAAILDALVVQLVVTPISFAMGLGVGFAGGAVSMPDVGRQVVAMTGGIALGLVASWLYEALMESSEKQATLGKMLLGIKVTDLAGARISFARATGRHFAKYISSMTLLIGYIMAGFTEKKQALHDMIAGTLVVRK